jgi:hypothetical protein
VAFWTFGFFQCLLESDFLCASLRGHWVVFSNRVVHSINSIISHLFAASIKNSIIVVALFDLDAHCHFVERIRAINSCSFEK